MIAANLFWRDAIGWEVIGLAAALALPYLVTSLIGQALFDPRHERLYRWLAYAVIGLAVITGLPIWEKGA